MFWNMVLPANPQFLITTEIKYVLSDIDIHMENLALIIRLKKWNVVRRWKFPFIRKCVQLRENKQPSKKSPFQSQELIF